MMVTMMFMLTVMMMFDDENENYDDANANDNYDNFKFSVFRSWALSWSHDFR